MEPNTPRPVATSVDLTSFLEKVDYTTIPLKRDLIPSVPREDQQILWVGCVDSYTIETDSIDVPRSELFVHRNLANLLSNGDLSGQAAIEMCMKILKVPDAASQHRIYMLITSHRSTISLYAAITAAP